MRHCVVSNYLKVMVEVQTTSTTVPTSETNAFKWRPGSRNNEKI